MPRTTNSCQSLRSVLYDLRERPTRSASIIATCEQALREEGEKKYRTQIDMTLLLRNNLRDIDHPLSPCVSDVLLGYGRAVMRLKD